ncbi:MAG: dicarboxylate/amino acid:cation symporter [Myxococcota bacterium]|nr:dicarboxylate/amino acid:cation symporter [Myxococcota bacterium]
MRFALIILVGLGLGVAAGLAVPSAGLWLALPGELFVAGLKALILPIVFCSVAGAMAKLGSTPKLLRWLRRAALYFVSTMILAVGLGLTLVNALQPGAGADRSAWVSDSEAPSVKPLTGAAFVKAQVGKLFMDPVKAWAQGNVLGVLVFALLFGMMLGRVHGGGAWVPLLESAEGALSKLIDALIWCTPVGVFSLAYKQVAASGIEPILRLGPYVLCVALGLVLHGLVILPLAVRLFGGPSPLRYLRGAAKPLMVAFSSASSAATLPVTLEAAEKELGVDPAVSRTVAPLGATINMDGTALYEAVAALFIAQVYGISLGVGDQIVVALTACLAAIGAAGIPSAGVVTMALVLHAVGLPLEGIGLILAVDRFLDMLRTSVNVLGDLGGCSVVAAAEPEPPA